jgi:type II secretion system protein N
MRKKILLAIPVFFLFVLVMFPYATFKNMAIVQLASRTGVHVFPESLTPSFLGLGVAMKDTSVQIMTPAVKRGYVAVDFVDLEAYLPWGGLLSFEPRVRVSGSLQPSCPLAVELMPKGSEVQLALELKSLPAKPYLTQLGLEAVGLNGTISLILDSVVGLQKQRIQKTHLQLTVDHLRSEEMELGGFLIPELSFSSPLQIRADSDDGSQFKLQLEIGQSETDPIHISSEGSWVLNLEKQSDSTFDLKNKIHIRPEFASHASFQLLLPLLESFQVDPGVYHVQVSGNLEQGVTGIPTKF